MNLKIQVLFVVLCFVFLQCKKPAQAQKNRFESSKIIMQKDPCYGTCPVYNITLLGSGKAIYEGKQHVSKIGRYERELTPKEISRLFNAFECANFFDFQQEYSDPNVMDLPTTWLTFEHRGFSRKVKDYFQAPEELKKLEQLVEEIGESEGWKKLE